MSNLVFPSFQGIDLAIKRRAIYATKVQTSASGKELRASFQSTPRYAYELKFNFLRQAGYQSTQDEVAQLDSFFDTMIGSWDSFLLNDPVDGVQRRVRFVDDQLDLEQILNQCWSGGTVKLISVK